MRLIDVGKPANVGRAQMQVALWVGDFHVIGFELVPDANEQVTRYIGPTVHRVVDPKAYFKVHRAIAIFVQ